MDTSMKNISTINPTIIDNTEDLLVKVHTQLIDQWRVGVKLGHGVSLPLLQLFQTIWVTFQAKNSMKIFSASNALTV